MTRFHGVSRALLTLVVTLALALLLVLAVGALASSAAASPDTVTKPAKTAAPAAVTPAGDLVWSGTLAEGKTLAIYGMNGGISAERASGNEVEVRATKKGKHSDPDKVRIEVSPHAGGVTICALYPDRKGRPGGTCEPEGATQGNVGNNDVSVEFRVRLPAGVRLVASTVNGGIEADDLDSEIELETVNGGVRAATLRAARVETVNGGIEVALGLAQSSAPLDFETVNGSIRVQIPDKAGVNLHASTVNGKIKSDFPVTMTGDLSRQHLDATIGGGGRRLRVATVNGSIHIEAAKIY